MGPSKDLKEKSSGSNRISKLQDYAVAVAMITPGPVVITVAFIGYLVAGVLGAVMAAIWVFVPC